MARKIRLIDVENITKKDLIDVDGLMVCYKKYLDTYMKGAASFILSLGGMDDPYNAEYILQKHEMDIEIDGTKYEVRSCWTEYQYCGLFHLADVQPFRFYMLFKKSDLRNGGISGYDEAEKWYVCKKKR